MTFKVIITRDEEYGGYVVDVPELTGCMSQGKTLDEALYNIKDAIKGWLYVEEKADYPPMNFYRLIPSCSQKSNKAARRKRRRRTLTYAEELSTKLTQLIE